MESRGSTRRGPGRKEPEGNHPAYSRRAFSADGIRENRMFFGQCEEEDSNLHSFRNQILSLARLPVPPSSRFVLRNYELRSATKSTGYEAGTTLSAPDHRSQLLGGRRGPLS